MDRSDWNARYAEKDLVWGAEPNQRLAAELAEREPRGRALDLACGEGRNAIWLAERGWQVTGIDFSDVAIERAEGLARRRGVEVEWHCADVVSAPLPEAAFGLVLIAYLQIPGKQLREVLGKAALALAAGGELLMIGHARRNLAEGIGGPRDPAVLWSPEEIETDLRAFGLRVERCEHVEREVETDEGVRKAIDVFARAFRSP